MLLIHIYIYICIYYIVRTSTHYTGTWGSWAARKSAKANGTRNARLLSRSIGPDYVGQDYNVCVIMWRFIYALVQ